MEFLLEYGYIGLFIGTFLAATILPFSSEFLLLGLLIAGADPWTCFLWAYETCCVPVGSPPAAAFQWINLEVH